MGLKSDPFCSGSFEYRQVPFGAGFVEAKNIHRVIVDAIKVAQNLLWQNLPPGHNLPDAAAVTRLRDLVRSPAVQSALLHSNDTFFAFVLRAVEFVLSDQFRSDRDVIDLLWDVLDDPYLNQALGIRQNSRITLGPYPKRR
jgi:hypothetical protein